MNYQKHVHVPLYGYSQQSKWQNHGALINENSTSGISLSAYGLIIMKEEFTSVQHCVEVARCKHLDVYNFDDLKELSVMEIGCYERGYIKLWYHINFYLTQVRPAKKKTVYRQLLLSIHLSSWFSCWFCSFRTIKIKNLIFLFFTKHLNNFR